MRSLSKRGVHRQHIGRRIVGCVLGVVVFGGSCVAAQTAQTSKTFAVEEVIRDMRVPCEMPGDSSKGSETQFFEDMHFVDARIGWVSEGTYWCWTGDGGVTWSPMKAEDGRRRFGEGFFINRRHGWVRWPEKESQFGETTDGGLHWNLFDRPKGTCYGPMQFTDERNGWNVGYGSLDGRSPARGYTILRTTDGGRTWEDRSLDLSAPIFGIHFRDGLSGWVASHSSGIFQTTDGGAHWTRQRFKKWESFERIRFLDADTGYAVGTNYAPDGFHIRGLILRTRDGGKTWSEPETPLAARLDDELEVRDVVILDEHEAWALGSSKAVFRTTDGGAHWTTISLRKSPAAVLSWASLVEQKGQPAILVLDSQGSLFRIGLQSRKSQSGKSAPPGESRR